MGNQAVQTRIQPNQKNQNVSLLKMRTFGSVIEDQVRVFGDTVKMGQLGKLNPDQFSYQLIKDVAKFIWELEETHKLESPIHKPADLFKMPLSYLYNLKTEHLEFIVHVPLTRPQQILDMYEFHPFRMPIPLTFLVINLSSFRCIFKNFHNNSTPQRKR